MVNGQRTQRGVPFGAPAVPAPHDGATDGQLLERFVHRRDGVAFATLLRRHGPMVLGVCRRVLRGGPDAEDAFQATFLVLARKAGTLGRPELLANWLYGVAYRTALHMRARSARRRLLEREAATMSASESEPDAGWQELRELLDDELQSLPEKYRAPLVLCYLEGLTNEQAARVLGWPAGSMSARLARGREMLRDRLTGRLRSVPGAMSPALLLQLLEPEAVPEPLADATVQAALAAAGAHALAAGLISPTVRGVAQATLRSLPVARRSLLTPLLAALVAALLLYAAACAVFGTGTFFPSSLSPSGTGGSCHTPAE
jgi:RNA polymerase sigma factor (sigma-70 family)